MARDIRLLLDTRTTDADLVDSNTGQRVFFYRAESLTFDVGLLQGGAVFNPSGYTYSVEVKERNSPSFVAYFSKTGSITGSLSTVADFDGGSEHFSATVSASENENSIAGTGWLVVKIMDSGGSVITTYAGEVAVLESGSSALAQGSDYTSALYVTEADKGTADGVAELDSTGKVPAAQLPVSTTATYKGAWDVALDVPNLGALTPTSGDYYIVSVAGTEDVTGDTNAVVEGDQLHYNGTAWELIPKPSDLKQPMIAANAAARAAATPDYVGQLLDQTDIGRQWRGTAESVGSWEPLGWGDVKLTAADGDVTWYAATADTDAARGTALTDAMDDSAAGDHVEIFNGTYEVSETVLVKSDQTLSGSGAGSVIKCGGFSGDQAIVSNIGYAGTGYTGATGFSVRDFKIASAENGMMFAHAANIRATRLHCDGMTNNHFFDLIACDDVVVTGCVFDGASVDSIWQIDQSSQDCGSIYDGATLQEVCPSPYTDTTSSRNIRFTGNHSNLSTANGAHYHVHRSGNSDIQIDGNTCIGGAMFVKNDSTFPAHSIIIRGNTVTTVQNETSGYAAIQFIGTSGQSDITDVTIEGNHIEHAGNEGIHLRECLRAKIADNTIILSDDGTTDSVLYAVMADQNSSVLVTGNIIRHTATTTTQYEAGAAIQAISPTAELYARDNMLDNWGQGFYGPGSPAVFDERGTAFNDVDNHVHGTTSIDTNSVPSPGDTALTWFRADRGIADTAGEVDSWTNRIDTTETLTAATTARPTVTDDPSLDADVLDFDATDDELSGEIDTIDTVNADFTWWLLVKDDDGGTNTDAKILVWANGPTNAEPIFQVRKGSSGGSGQDVIAQSYSGAAYSTVTTTVDTFTGTNWKLLKVQRDGTAVQIKDGTFTKGVSGSVHATLDTTSASSDVWVGRRYGGSPDYWDGQIAEVICYSGTMAGQAEYDVYRYFASKYGPEILSP